MSTFYCISEIYLKTWIFAKLLTPKELIIEMSKRSYFRTPFDTQSWTNPKHCCYVHGSTFILLLHYSKMNWAEKCLFLVRCEILRQLSTDWLPMRSILAIEGRISCNQFKYYYLTHQKLFSQFHRTSEMCMKIWRFWGKNEAYNVSICEIIDSEKRGYLNVKKVLFQNTLQQ